MNCDCKLKLTKKEIENPGESIRAFLHESLRINLIETVYQMLHDEVAEICGESHKRGQKSKYRRAGSEKGSIAWDGARIPVKRPRVRTETDEIPLETYLALRDYDFLNQDMMKLLIRGISTRDFSEVKRKWDVELGLSKSSASRAFQKASQKSLDEINGRDLSSHHVFAMMIDGIQFADVHIIAALGFTSTGEKVILGLREGATENAAVVKDLLQNIIDRHLSTTDDVLFVLDGAKALKSAVTSHFGKRAVIQRCQLHKQRNVLRYLPKDYHTETIRRLKQAWGMTKYEDAKTQLHNTVQWLALHSQSASNSLKEGFEETLTVHRLEMPAILRKTFATSNPIESMFDKIACRMKRVKNWNGKNQVARWSAASLLLHEKKFRRIKGHRELPLVITELTKLHLDATGKVA